MPFRVLAALAALAAPVCAQHIRFGFVGGTAVTSDVGGIDDTYPNNLDPFQGRYTFRLFDRTTSRSPVLGPSFELDLKRHLSVEINALSRRLTSTQIATFLYENGTAAIVTSEMQRAKTWEFPILLKYGRPMAGFTPYVEAGPSFRVWHEPLGLEPSKIGVTGGLGVDFAFGCFRAGPLIRYTRWRADGGYPLRSTKPDQVEVLGSFSYQTSHASRSIGARKIRLTLLGGLPLSRGLNAPSIAGLGPFVRESRSYIAGLGISGELTRRLSIEANGLYRPIHARQLGYLLDGTQVSGDEFTVLTWPLPILAKYRLSSAKYRPFVEAGPAFRLSGNKNGYEPSRVGFTAGFGLEFRAGKALLGPALRYTRWQADSRRRFGSTARDQADLVMSFSF